MSSLARQRRTRRGFTLVEALIAMMIVGIVGVAALSAAAQATSTRRRLDDGALGRDLARMMLEEVLSKGYEESNAALPTVTRIGLDEQENPGGARDDLDDVDDYQGFTTGGNAGVTDALGLVVDGTVGWSVSVRVTYLHPLNFAPATREELVAQNVALDYKRVSVRVARAGRQVATQDAMVSRGWGELNGGVVVAGEAGGSP